jgi:hypothetical protein
MNTQVISTTLLHTDGTIEVVSAAIATPEPDLGLFGPDGYSVKSILGVCFECLEVEQYRGRLLAGDAFQVAAAATLPKFFCLILPDRDQTDEEKLLVKRNHNQDGAAWAYVTGNGTMRFQEFYPDALGLDESEWGDAAGPNIVVPIGGPNPNDDYEHVAREIIEDTETAIGAARRFRPGMPVPSPKRPD